jgi:UDP-N-acetylmuramoyl-L-alanyl-D-glutamate--2,6-diaminopimelate ligase
MLQAPWLSDQPITLNRVASCVPGSRLVGDATTLIDSVFHDSRKVQGRALFVVRTGGSVNGKAFVSQAIQAGAQALLCAEDDLDWATNWGIPLMVVPDVRRALAQASAGVYGFSPDQLCLIGITGTNGKTTCTHLLRQLLDTAGVRTASLGTLGCSFENHQLFSQLTTPESDDLARLTAGLRSLGASHLVMEVSSHALELERVAACQFDVAAFTNLSHDHLDFHGTMENYAAAKSRLFFEFQPRCSVLNLDDPYGEKWSQALCSPCVSYSVSGKENATITCRSAQFSAHETRAELVIRGEPLSLVSPLVGKHNLENLCLVIGSAMALGLSPAHIVPLLATVRGVAGRLEACHEDLDNLAVFVDYAHTPDALDRVLQTLRPLTSGALWCVFGCGGDRDAAKRPVMGTIAAQYADRLIVTNDNPRSEVPDTIAAAIVAGMGERKGEAEVILDRRQAIEFAIEHASPGDSILIAGKGHEPYQIIGSQVFDFNDRTEACRALAQRRSATHLWPR